MKLFSNSAIVLAMVAASQVIMSSMSMVQSAHPPPSDPCSGLDGLQCDASTECIIIEPNGFEKCVLAIGFLSVVRQGKNNIAPGDFCTVGGGEDNSVGLDGGNNSGIGGGRENDANGNKAVISGGSNNIIEDGQKGVSLGWWDTISGGKSNDIDTCSTSVITGGRKNEVRSSEDGTISGGIQNLVKPFFGPPGIGNGGGVVTGGINNGVQNTNSVVTGGKSNIVDSDFGSVVVGGQNNAALGGISIAFGENAVANKNGAMVVNLMDNNGQQLVSEFDGQFLIEAKSYRLQIGKSGGDNNLSTLINEDNIDKLIDALKN